VKEKILIQTIKELFLQEQLNKFDEMLKEYCKCALLTQDIEILPHIQKGQCPPEKNNLADECECSETQRIF